MSEQEDLDLMASHLPIDYVNVVSEGDPNVSVAEDQSAEPDPEGS